MANVVCGWHKMYFPTEPVPILGPFSGPLDSHGICARCAARVEAEQVQAHAQTPAEIIKGNQTRIEGKCQ